MCNSLSLSLSLSRPHKISNYRVNRYDTKYPKFKNVKTYEPILLLLSRTGKLWTEQRFVVFGSHNEHHIQDTIDRFIYYNGQYKMMFLLDTIPMIACYFRFFFLAPECPNILDGFSLKCYSNIHSFSLNDDIIVQLNIVPVQYF